MDTLRRNGVSRARLQGTLCITRRMHHRTDKIYRRTAKGVPAAGPHMGDSQSTSHPIERKIFPTRASAVGDGSLPPSESEQGRGACVTGASSRMTVQRISQMTRGLLPSALSHSKVRAQRVNTGPRTSRSPAATLRWGTMLHPFRVLWRRCLWRWSGRGSPEALKGTLHKR